MGCLPSGTVSQYCLSSSDICKMSLISFSSAEVARWNCMVNVHDEKKFSVQTTKKKIRLR